MYSYIMLYLHHLHVEKKTLFIAILSQFRVVREKRASFAPART